MATKSYKAKGHKFVFTLEPDQDDMLHIFARHLKDHHDAMYIFFNGETKWLAERDCWETALGNEGLWWNWINEKDKVVRVISCFDFYS